MAALMLDSFIDRDMLMRYHWGLGVGHYYAWESQLRRQSLLHSFQVMMLNVEEMMIWMICKYRDQMRETLLGDHFLAIQNWSLSQTQMLVETTQNFAWKIEKMRTWQSHPMMTQTSLVRRFQMAWTMVALAMKQPYRPSPT